jgi:hydrogenase maturation protein HypF
MTFKALDIHVAGIVQGVGFRPFIYRLAQQWGLAGWVLNASDGVHIHIEGEDRALEGFSRSLPQLAPPAARISSLSASSATLADLQGFEIRNSRRQDKTRTQISPDIATCPDCLRELFDPTDRRYLYPFINCTNCGPRFTIIRALPYDRPETSMAPFTMCPDCAAEYHDPANRRFHAQPDACFECGPTLSLWKNGVMTAASDREQSQALIKQVATLLNQGAIVAIKGLGGYHLACDATNEQAVRLLRKRKHRYGKPFALMLHSLADAESLCQVNALEAELLTGTARPIVLLERKGAGESPDSPARPCSQLQGEAIARPATTPVKQPSLSSLASQGAAFKNRQPDSSTPLRPIAPSVAGDLHELGVMLPYTPLQHLLLAAVDVPLVMTSGNLSEEPILAQEAEAHERLSGVADAFLDHNRAILSRYDDSVVRVVNGQMAMIRLARGYAPAVIAFPQLGLDHGPLPPLLATGSEQKSTFCLVNGTEALVSQHIGDLENAATMSAWLATLSLYESLFDLEPEVLAADMHPDYLSGKWARAQEAPLIEVQHHHAHIAGVLAEHKALGHDGEALLERVIGVAFDGTGYGEDRTIWGGEILLVTLESFERFAHLALVPLPGGRAAIKHPDRMAYSYLSSFGLLDHPAAVELKAQLGEDRCLLLDQILQARLNSPDSSSMGRLFDAVSAILGINTTASYEGQAAVELEAALYSADTALPTEDPEAAAAAERYSFSLCSGGAKSASQDASQGSTAALPPLIIDPSPVLTAILDDRSSGVPSRLISLRFHQAVAHCIVDICNRARRHSGLATVALSGGVFMNRYLLSQVVPLLESEGFNVLQHQALPVNDGCISYGQAAVASAQLAQVRMTELKGRFPCA